MLSINLRKVLRTVKERTTFKDHGYQLLSKLGEGGFGKVYRAQYTVPKTGVTLQLACKIIDTADQQYIKKFLVQELVISANLNHPHIIQIHSICQWEYKVYIFMRQAENGDLLDYVIDYGPVNEKLARFWTRQLALAVQYMHTLEIAHRDIKCENILITSNKNIKLTDFGFARTLLDANRNNVMSDTFCGSISYASPQIFSGKHYDPKATDMWSIGCVIYVMLNKAPPFNADTIKELYTDQMLKNYGFRKKYKYNHTREVITLVYRLLEPNEILRYKIEELLKSEWISMDFRLKSLNQFEYTALMQAKTSICSNAKRKCVPYNRDDIHNNIEKFQTGINFFKKYDEGFNLQLINSQNNLAKRLST